jgi:hypothetical protein
VLVKEPKKTGVRIARARTRNENLLVTFIEVNGFSFSFFISLTLKDKQNMYGLLTSFFQTINFMVAPES